MEPPNPDVSRAGETESPLENDTPNDGNLIVVGIGASAGGLEAFTELLRYLPPATGMAFVLVQHLDPHYKSVLTDLLAKQTKIPLVQVSEGTVVEGDHIYVIPPNTQMLLENHTLRLEARPDAPARFCPIDVFFKSVAEGLESSAVGVVLSGTASDGTSGLRSIKAAGGITFAQDETAKFDGMPRSAIAAGVVDLVLPPRRIAEELAAIALRRPNLSRTASTFADGYDKILQRILHLLRKHHGVDFSEYKLPTIQRRLSRRMLVRNSASLEDYYEFLQNNPEESKTLFDDLLINVTEFFRDAEVFETAKVTVFPAIVREHKPPRPIRIWIPGCSSGEEVYSLAIALVEYLESEELYYSIQIFGTDISDSAIARARAGTYDESAVGNVSPERLRRFFSRTELGYRISRTIRDMCIFSLHDITKDPPLSRMHLISCRNLLIYFAPTLQRRVLSLFAYALVPSGCLILGPSETLGGLTEEYSVVDGPNKIYCRKTEARTLPLPPAGELPVPESWRVMPPATPQVVEDPGGRVHKEVNNLVLLRYGPAGVVVDEALRIMEYRGDMDPYTSAAGSTENGDLFQMVHEELRAAVSTLIEQARRTELSVIAERVALSRGRSRPTLITITAVPIKLSGVTRHFLVLFGHAGEQPPNLEFGVTSPSPDAALSPADTSNVRLAQELRSTREYLQSVVEELRSANEEAQSANEELQSTNEELQTSKEELQASNEELHTINAEMQSRNAELARLNDDLFNLLSSMNVPIVMTGADLRIRRFTPMAQRVLHLIPADIGRPIADLKPRINVPRLDEILQQVLDTLQPHEQEVVDQEGQAYLMRVGPYRTADHRIDGTVLQLVDVTELKRNVEELKHARDYAEGIVNAVREPLVVLDQDLVIQHANRAFEDALRLHRGASVGQSIFDAAYGQFDSPTLRQLLEPVTAASGDFSDMELELRRDDETRILVVSSCRLHSPDRKRLHLVAFSDITERKRAAEARYRRLFESSRDGIVLVDAHSGEVMDINPYTERLLGYSRGEIVGRKLWDTEPMRQVPQLRAALQQIRDEGAFRFDDLRLHNKDGAELHSEVLASVYWEGERQSIQFNIRDVSERKKFERELQETQRLESLGLLAGGIAHDFNNLLTGILGNASLVLSDLPPADPLRLRVREIVQASERAAFLTRQMLAYAGRGRFVTEVLDLGELVREISTLVRTSIPKSVELQPELGERLPPIEADPTQIQQLVMNLVINGAEAVGDNAVGSVVIRTSLREIDRREAAEAYQAEHLQPGSYVQLEVKDTGSGMDEETRRRIFDPFFTTKFTGRGLGLAAVQGIVKTHGGAIRVYSTPGVGTTFVIIFPAKQGRSSVAKAPKSRPIQIPPGSVALVIDDEETVRSLVTNVLTREGWKTLTAENGKIGVDLFQDHHAMISVVILDLQMPVMGGQETLEQLRRINPRIPVILSSGFDETEAARRFSRQKPERFLQKPYTKDRLVEAIAATLQRSRNRPPG